MITTEQVDTVLSRFNHLLSRDGGKLSLKDLAEDRITVDYAVVEGGCEACVLNAEDLGEMIREALPADAGAPTVTILTHNLSPNENNVPS